jgi:hypothetical protein
MAFFEDVPVEEEDPQFSAIGGQGAVFPLSAEEEVDQRQADFRTEVFSGHHHLMEESEFE